MVERLLIASLAAVLAATSASPPAIAQATSNQSTLSSIPARMQLRDQIALMTSLSPTAIEVRASNDMIRVILVNTDYNADPPSHREHLASTISALVNKNAQADPGYKPVLVLHVEFVKRGNLTTRTIDMVEFRRDASGAFVRHTT